MPKMKKEYGYCLTSFLVGIIIIPLDKLGLHWFNGLTWIGVVLMLLGILGAISFYYMEKRDSSKPHKI